jgi:hypothetical protein
MSAHDLLGLGPIYVVGRGWISPEARALMQKAQDDCAAAQAAREARGDTPISEEPPTGDPPGFVVDPYNCPR